MTRSIARKPKRRSEAQIRSLQKADLARWRSKHDVEADTSEEIIHNLKHQMSDYKQQLNIQKTKYWNERRRNYRLQKAHIARKVDLKHVNSEAYKMQGALQMLGKELKEIQAVADESTHLLSVWKSCLETAKRPRPDWTLTASVKSGNSYSVT